MNKKESESNSKSTGYAARPSIKKFLFLKGLTLLILCSAVFFISRKLDLLEAFVKFAHNHEEYELDELIIVSIFLMFYFAFFFVRRWNETNRLNFILKKKNTELQETIEELNQLRGIIPICSSCMKIRDDRGYWERVDKYIASKSKVLFSHSLCPDCIKKLYPDTLRKP